MNTSWKLWVVALGGAALMAACGGGSDGGDSLFGGGAGSGGEGTGTGAGTTPGGGISDVSSGIANQRFMSISVEKYALDWGIDGDTTSIRISVADKAGNPVPDGTTVQFSVEGGQVETSCKLTGVKDGTSTISACEVTFSTQNFRPLDAYVSVVAWLQGEEAFRDLNANGKHDSGEPFYEGGKIFRDDNDNGVYDPGIDELNIGATLGGEPGVATSTCVQGDVPINPQAAPLSVADTCDAAWGSTLVRADVRLPLSNGGSIDAVDLGGGQVLVFSSFNGIDVSAPSGTTLAIKQAAASCTTAVISPSKVPNNAVVPTIHQLSGGIGCAGSAVTLEITFGDYKRVVSATIP